MEKINCLRCNFRHTDNVNCTAVGGFCTAVQADHCPLLREYLDTGLTPDQVVNAKNIIDIAFADDTSKAERIRELLKADKDGRVVVLPCKVGERWVDEDGRAVRITAVIVSMEPFGENINIYFDYEDATPDDAGSDCMTNWHHFSRQFTCIEAERATEGKRNG